MFPDTIQIKAYSEKQQHKTGSFKRTGKAQKRVISRVGVRVLIFGLEAEVPQASRILTRSC